MTSSLSDPGPLGLSSGITLYQWEERNRGRRRLQHTCWDTWSTHKAWKVTWRILRSPGRLHSILLWWDQPHKKLSVSWGILTERWDGGSGETQEQRNLGLKHYWNDKTFGVGWVEKQRKPEDISEKERVQGLGIDDGWQQWCGTHEMWHVREGIIRLWDQSRWGHLRVAEGAGNRRIKDSKKRGWEKRRFLESDRSEFVS